MVRRADLMTLMQETIESVNLCDRLVKSLWKTIVMGNGKICNE